jgi:methyl-accepting chemotaxis protein
VFQIGMRQSDVEPYSRFSQTKINIFAGMTLSVGIFPEYNTISFMVMQQIAEKIMIIEEITGQTRLLSLNATIEAARAQEHGRAFSVVAAEIRKLSDITKKAAEEINKLATSSLDVSERAGDILATLVPSIHQTAMLVQEITAASAEQSTPVY